MFCWILESKIIISFIISVITTCSDQSLIETLSNCQKLYILLLSLLLFHLCILVGDKLWPFLVGLVGWFVTCPWAYRWQTTTLSQTILHSSKVWMKRSNRKRPRSLTYQQPIKVLHLWCGRFRPFHCSELDVFVRFCVSWWQNGQISYPKETRDKRLGQRMLG